MKIYSKRRVLTLMLMAAMALLLLSGCGKKDDTPTPPASDGVQDGQQVTIPGYDDSQQENAGQGDVSFGLQDPGDPDFSDIGTGIDDGLYTIENGYAYALDPTTFDKTGPALDPVTHEVLDPQPVFDEISDVEQTDPNVVAPEENTTEGSGEQTPPEQLPPATPTIPDEVKLPNTGIFLEDD